VRVRDPLHAALAGLLAAAVALAAGELIAGLVDGASLVAAVGDLVIDHAPRSVERFAIDVFGTNDKPALLTGTIVIAVLVGALIGRLAPRRFPLAAAALVAFGGFGIFAAQRQTELGRAILTGALAAGAGVGALRVLVDRAPRVAPAVPGPMGAGGGDRRAFFAWSGGAAATAVVVAAAGRKLAAGADVSEVRAAVALPDPAAPAPALPRGAELGIDGLTPITTPNDGFYRIDTALVIPQVDPAGWSMAVTGLVERPLTLTYDDLLARDLVEVDVTLACVSNEVNGELIGNARWLGVPLAELLDEAGVDPSADQLVGRSVDGFTAGFPVAQAYDRDAIVAVGMNGEPLPVRHGFPARLVVPGLYGYVSATKWLSEVELTTFAEFDGYWIRRGWAALGPIKTQCRIDLPNKAVTEGQVVVAGVAWAQHRGIERVEVRVDGGEWVEAELAEAISVETWRQWIARLPMTTGDHTVEARAWDRDGPQTEERADVFPDGATGYPTRRIRVG
jgi:DMSO/TMAO reductase YedYZ molybdopterin-dependent catalytic subunit